MMRARHKPSQPTNAAALTSIVIGMLVALVVPVATANASELRASDSHARCFAADATILTATSAGSVRSFDLLTPRHDYDDWALTLLDSTYALPSRYVPPDLVSVSVADIAGKGSVRMLVIDDLRALAMAAESAGVPLAVASAYRSHATQARLFQKYVARQGTEALLGSARPGHSEHQLGTSIDFKSANGARPWRAPDWATTRTSQWLAANAWRFGFVMSYPANATASTGYGYEPWHYRYVGRSQAAAIRAAGVTPREWLWSVGGCA